MSFPGLPWLPAPLSHHFRLPTAPDSHSRDPLTMHRDLHLSPGRPCLIGGLASKEARVVQLHLGDAQYSSL